MSRSVGVEEEFLLLRRDGDDLVERGDDIATRAAAADGDGQYEHELKRAQVELGSQPSTSLAQLGTDLAGLRGRLAAAAAQDGARLVASGTDPQWQPARVTPERRYREMTDDFGQVARQALTCGMHIHVGIDDPAQGVAVLDAIGPWLPVLTALSANSPFYAGQDTGLASYRAVLWGNWPTAGPTSTFGDEATYRRVGEQLIALGAARDEGMLYFDARLSRNYPTVELRVCDVAPTVDDAVTIAALARGLVTQLATGPPAVAGHRTELLRAASWQAARTGMAGDLVDLVTGPPRLRPAWDVVDALVESVRPALDAAGDLGRVRAGLSVVRERGTGAEQQRAAYAKRNEFADVLDRLSVR